MGRKVTLLGPAPGALRPSPERGGLALAVDCAVLTVVSRELAVLLVRRAREPFAGRWALPGGFVGAGETLDQAARRELAEETGVRAGRLEQLGTFGDPGRDPRGRVVSVAHLALLAGAGQAAVAGSDAGAAAWIPVSGLPPLAFDHRRIVALACERLRDQIRRAPVGFELLPERFSLSGLQQVYESVLGLPLDKRNFRKKLLGMGVLAESGAAAGAGAPRAARLYRFDHSSYGRLVERGFRFDV